MKTFVAEDFGVAAGSIVHAFELAGLGKAPYRYIGMTKMVYQACPEAPVQPGGTCNFCGTPIMFAYGFKSADGKRFIVGSDCVFKSEDAGLKRAISRDKAKHDKAVRDARTDRQFDAAKEFMASAPAVAFLGFIESLPHPHGYFASTGKTLRDYWTFILNASGKSTYIKNVNKFRKMMKEDAEDSAA